MASSAAASPLIQYVVMRTDLKWTLGALAAQAAHAAVAAVWMTKDAADTNAYCAPEAIDSMHKVVLGCGSREQLEKIADTLRTDGVAFKLWNEQPENVPTCLATAPAEKGAVAVYFAGLKLLR
jgi:peptidyl-tRNA hydrolase